MSRHIERRALVNHSAQQMYDLVNDVESYPKYMAGCVGAVVLDRQKDSLTARLDLAKAGIRQSFTTRNKLQPPERITMELVNGPFRRFHGRWEFRPIDDSSCEVVFRLDYEFSSFLLGLTAAPLINAVVGEQVDAVCQRAMALYG